MAFLYLVIGIPGSGKTTWIKNNFDNRIKERKVVYVSRDEIRFSLLKDGENYFEHEPEVLDIFYSKINEALEDNKSVVVDQTSLTPQSRKKLINHLNFENLKEEPKLIGYFFNIPINICIKRNEKRDGRRRVPEQKINYMNSILVPPSYGEGFDKIYLINKDNEIALLGQYC